MINATHTEYAGPKFSSPCCGQCWITVPSVEVLYWPTPAVSGPSTTVSNGYTFRSPSVYIDFVTAQAMNACGRPGNYSSRVTLAFDRDELSTLYNNPGKTRRGQIERPFNFADFNTLDCGRYTNSNISRTNDPFANGNPCFPTVIAPTGASALTEINPEWAGCSVQAQMLDPPRVLTSVAALGPTTTTAPEPSFPPASPIAIPQKVPSKTPAPSSEPTRNPFFGPLPVHPDPETEEGSDSDAGSTPNGGSRTGSSSDPQANTGSNLGSGSESSSSAGEGSGSGLKTDPNVNTSPKAATDADIGSDASSGPLSKTGSTGSDTTGGSDAGKGSLVGTSSVQAQSSQKGKSGSSGMASDSAIQEQEHKHSSVKIGGVGVYVPTQGQSSIVLGHHTASVGGPPVTVDHTPISLGTSHLVVDGTSSHQFVPTAQPTGSSTIAIGDHSIAITASDASRVVIGSQTAVVGGPRITISHTPVSLGSDALVVGSSTHVLSSKTSSHKAIEIGEYHITPPVPGSSLIIGTQTLVPGEAITVSSTPISLGSSVLVVGTSTVPLLTSGPDLTTNEHSHHFAIGSQTITVKPTGVVVGSQTLHPGGPAITVSGTSYSLGTTEFIAGTLTETFPAATTFTKFRPEVFISGLSQISASSVPVRKQNVITVADETITVKSSEVVVHGMTLTLGASGITVDGTIVSLGTSKLVVGDKTEALGSLAPAEYTIPVGIGAAIMSAFGQMGAAAAATSIDGISSVSAGVGTGGSSASTSAKAFKGSAARSIALGGLTLVASWSCGLAALMCLL